MKQIVDDTLAGLRVFAPWLIGSILTVGLVLLSTWLLGPFSIAVVVIAAAILWGAHEVGASDREQSEIDSRKGKC